ncbi:unnamed protein product [Pseudo-nitzschia multistriata]|uniref:N-acetyltransferase domain-containing protein n=1 Tax=Pseudo-nitzschia multistriata TaxID=183589 RepID=A0A448ZDE7_9STRA|nr:unnamed protein product [Pseudo-nitzschia multistriata]
MGQYDMEQVGITYKVAWQKNDEIMMKDACKIWKEMGLIKEEGMGMPRAKLLSVVAYEGDKMVGLSTLTVAMQQQVFAKACHFRCVVRPEYRRRHIATEMAIRSLALSEEWSEQNPSYKVLAFVIRVETQDLTMKCYEPVWNNKMNFIGYSAEGLPLYLRWFKHATFGNPNEDPDFTFYPNRPGRI